MKCSPHTGEEGASHESKKNIAPTPVGLAIIVVFAFIMLSNAMNAAAAQPESTEVVPYGPQFSFYIASVNEGYSVDDYGIRVKNAYTTKGMVCNQWTEASGVGYTNIPTNFIFVKSPGGMLLSDGSINICSDSLIHTLNYASSYIPYGYNTKLRANSGSTLVGYLVEGLWNPNWV